MGLHRVLNIIFPTQCLLCGDLVQSNGGLCGQCWRETPFVIGLSCDLCGAPLPGDDDHTVQCDDCRATPRPWDRGRAVMVYKDGARRLVLGLKHGDRLDLVPSLSTWMAKRAADLIDDSTVIAPVPLHRWRLLKRRYNQAAVLAGALAEKVERPHIPDLLVRNRRTRSLGGLDPDARFAEVSHAISVSARRQIEGRTVLLVDDVMTSGATLAACATACLEAGASQTRVLVLARAVRDT